MTPQWATELLSTIKRQRPLNRPHVAHLSSEILEGRWELTNDAVCVAVDGSLINGQHRLTAIKKTGIPVDVLLAEGLSSSSFTKMDIPRKRSAADMVALSGGTNAASASSVVSLVVRYENQEVSLFGWRILSNEQVVEEYVKRKVDIDRSVAMGRGVPRGLGIGVSVVAGTHYLISKIDPVDATRFIRAFNDGDASVPEAFRLREALLRRGRGRLSSGEGLAIMLNAWRNHRSGRSVSKTRSPLYIQNDAPFPTVAE
jgi:hypothetical protein